MKKRLSKAIPLSLVSLLSLTGCAKVGSLIQNIVGTILVNATINLPFIVNGVDVLPGNQIGGTPELMEWETMPTTENLRADFYYLKNIFVLPERISTNILGMEIKVDFNAEFKSGDEDALDSFHKLTVSQNDLPDGFSFDLSALPFPMDFTLAVYIPIGESELLDDVDSFDDLTGLVDTTSNKDLLDAVNQEEKDITLRVTAQSGTAKKAKNFYFHLLKPEFGQVIFDEIFKQNFLLNVFEYSADISEENIQDAITSVENPPVDEGDRLELAFFKKSLVIPKKIETKDLGFVLFDYEVTNTDLLFETTLARDVSEFAPDNEFVQGEIEVYALTPVGTYRSELGSDVDTIEELKDHFTNPDAAKAMYHHAFQDPAPFKMTLTITLEETGESDSRDYFFIVEPPMLDDEILEFVIDNDFMVNKVFYRNLDDVAQQPLPTNQNNPMTVQYLTETLAIPEQVVLKEFVDGEGNPKVINFDVEIGNNNEDADLFYIASKTVGEETPNFEDYDVTIKTLTPLGGLTPQTPSNQLEAFADEVIALAEEDAKQLYNDVSQPEENVQIRVTASTFDARTNTTTTKSNTFYFRLVPADIDGEIINHVIKDDALLNLVKYEDVKDGNYDDKILSVGGQARSEDNPLEIEHFVDTLVLPEQIVLTDFGNKTLRITTDMDYSNESSSIFRASRSLTIDENDVTAQTLTSLGSFDPEGVDDGDLEGLASKLDTLDAKDWYNHSQAQDLNLKLIVTVELLRPDNSVSETDHTTFYIKVSKPNIDKRIGEALLSDYEIVNYLRHFELNEEGEPGLVTNPVQPRTDLDRYELGYFSETLLFPTGLSFNDFGDKAVTFDIDFNGSENLFHRTTKEFEYDGQTITGDSYTPIGTYGQDNDLSSLVEFADISNHIQTNLFNVIMHNNTQNVDGLDVMITITVSINGVAQSSQDYYFRLVKTPI